MTQTINFEPNFTVCERLKPTYTIAELEGETSVYSATPEFVREHCGPVAVSILDAVPESYYEEAAERGLYPNCDIRVHRLYPGNVPAYPGWHCDGAFRETYFCQPDPDRTQVGEHLICTVSTDPRGVSNTKFLSTPTQLEVGDDAEPDGNLWKKLDRHIETLPSRVTVEVPDGHLMRFDSWTPHTATPAKIRGWRLFFRMAMWYRPNLGPGGQISRQEMIYIPGTDTGW